MAVEYLGAGEDDGSIWGRDATSKIGAYGATPVVQRSSTVLHTSLISASSYVTVAANLTAIVGELAAISAGLGFHRVTA